MVAHSYSLAYSQLVMNWLIMDVRVFFFLIHGRRNINNTCWEVRFNRQSIYIHVTPVYINWNICSQLYHFCQPTQRLTLVVKSIHYLKQVLIYWMLVSSKRVVVKYTSTHNRSDIWGQRKLPSIWSDSNVWQKKLTNKSPKRPYWL